MIKVKTIGAVINGQPIGSTVEMTEAEAEHYAKLGYVENVKEPTPKPVKKESAPKKPATKAKGKKSTKDDVKSEDKPKGK